MSYPIPEIPKCVGCGRIAEIDVYPADGESRRLCNACIDLFISPQWFVLRRTVGTHYVSDKEMKGDDTVYGPSPFAKAWAYLQQLEADNGITD